jgi:hypothetical protein
MPMNWWPSDDIVSDVIESEGPWPRRAPASNGIFVPLDVDKYDSLAVVVGHGRNRKGRDVLGSDGFQLNDMGTWEHVGGGGNAWSIGQRWDMEDERDALHLRMTGSTGTSPFAARREFSFAVFLCGPLVAAVEVARRRGTRIAEVSAGPGWFAVLWTRGDPATVSAYSAAGHQSFLWASPEPV